MLENSLSFSNEQPAHQPFNGIAALQAHLDQRKVVEIYVDGKSTSMPSLPTSCHGSCTVGKWLHGENGKNCKDLDLVDSLCKSCTEFREAATHAVLLAYTGYSKLAKEALLPGKVFFDSSEEFQQSLVKFNHQYSSWAEDR